METEGWGVNDLLQKIGLHRRQVLVIMMCGFAYASFMEQGFLATLATSSIQLHWPDLTLSKTRYNWVFAGSAFGRLFGSLLFVPLADVYGRLPVLTVGLIALAILCGLNAAMWNFASYAACRSLGMAVASVLPSVTTMITLEMVTLRSRALPSTILQTFHVLSIIYISAANLLLDSESPTSWRYIYIMGLLPILISLLLLIFCFKETPRFYISQNQEEKAWGTLHWLDVRSNLEGIHPQLVTGPTPLVEEKHSGAFTIITKNACRMIRVLNDRKHRRDTILLSLLWCFIAFAYWGATTYMTTYFKLIGINKNLATFVCFAVELPAMAFTYWLLNLDAKIGRLKIGGRIGTLMFCCAINGIGLLGLVGVVAGNVTAQWPLWLFAVMTYLFAGPVWNAVYIYSAELYPTNARGGAMALFSSINSLTTVVTTFVGALSLSDKTKWVYPLVFGVVWFLTLILCCFFTNETRDEDLRDH